ncbi:MAG: ABC transporter substrate-binding protein [Alphaproteobacteria bacterium]|nr:ABC transporter substrate-binding protein [Alphaproteobacteria bacterium]
MVLTRLLLAAVLVSAAAEVWAEGASSPGVTDTQIKIGQTIAYSGPASSFATIGRTQAAYYRMTNDKSGINGRKIEFISLDDGYSPPKTVEQTRRLVEQDGVFGIFGSLGTPTNASVQRYLNEHKVPQMFLFTGTSRFRDPQHYPWTIGGDLSFVSETRGFAKFILKEKPDATIAVLYQNDDYGKDHLNTLKAALGDRANTMIVAEASYESTDPTVDSQIVSLKAAGADVLLDVALPKFAAQAIRKSYDIDWHPLHIVPYPASSIPLVMQPAGLDHSVGVITAEFLKEPGDPAWQEDPDVRAYLDFMKTDNAGADPNDWSNVIAYYMASAVVGALNSCGPELTRERLLERVSHMEGVQVPMLIPGITLNTTPADYNAIKQMRLKRFDGTRWVPLGDVTSE